MQILAPVDVPETQPERARRWLRFNPIFASREEAAQGRESYRAFAY